MLGGRKRHWPAANDGEYMLCCTSCRLREAKKRKRSRERSLVSQKVRWHVHAEPRPTSQNTNKRDDFKFKTRTDHEDNIQANEAPPSWW